MTVGRGTGADPIEIAAVDALLDRLAARRPRAEDLDDSAVAALALLAAEIDLCPVPEVGLRRRLRETRIIDLRDTPPGPAASGSAASGSVASGSAPARGVPHARSAADVQLLAAPRPLRARLLAIAAVAVVGLWGAGVAVTGAPNPWRAGQVLAGADDASQIETMLDDGLRLVGSRDLTAGRVNLENAYAWSRTADLSPDQRRRVEAGIEELSVALSREGVPLPVALRPGGLSSPSPAASMSAAWAAPVLERPAPVVTAPTSAAVGGPMRAVTVTKPPLPPGGGSSSKKTGPWPLRTVKTTGPAASAPTIIRSKDVDGDRSTTKRPKKTKSDD